jgi:hypothetical protein
MDIDEDNFEHPGYYLFQCEICHKQIEVLSKHEVEKCLACQKVICKNCSTFGFCSKDFQSFSQTVQEKIIEAETIQKRKTRIRQMLIWIISIPLSIELLLSYLNGYKESIGWIIMLLLFSGTITMLGTNIRLKTIKAKLKILENVRNEQSQNPLKNTIKKSNPKVANQREIESSNNYMNEKELTKENPERKEMPFILSYPRITHSDLHNSEEIVHFNQSKIPSERVHEENSSFSFNSFSSDTHFSH